MSETKSPTGRIAFDQMPSRMHRVGRPKGEVHTVSLKDVDYSKLETRALAQMAEQRRVAKLVANTEAVNTATGRLGLLCATSRAALRLNAGLQRAFKHDALVAAGVFPSKLTGRQMDAV